MEYVVCFVGGAAAAASALLIWYFGYITLLRSERNAIKAREVQIHSDSLKLTQQLKSLDERQRKADEEISANAARQSDELATRRLAFEQSATAQDLAIQERRRGLQEDVAAFEGRKVRYDELVRENSGLKQDLFNLSVQLKKTERDQAALACRQEEIARKANELGGRYLSENVTWIGAKLTPRNFSSSKDRLLKVIESCRSIGFDVAAEKEKSLVDELRKDFEEAVRQEFAREEQARIRAQIREEERLAREVEKQIQDAERETTAIQAALDKALKEAKDEHSAEVELLRSRLKEAEEKAQRAISQAQLTKAGHVYVLSNIGCFGEGVFKIGMTRRIEPMDRVKELGDASVPFPFDVHMMISCDDAPGLENALHREFHGQRVNKVNFRKEYFRADFESIRRIVAENHGDVAYVAEPAALEYRESLSMRDEDYEFVERTVQSVIEQKGASVVED
jgi:hypothetical protein